MGRSIGFKSSVLVAILLVCAVARPADAYLDANTGSLLIQLLVGGVAGLALAGKLMWHRIAGIFRSSEKEHDDQNGDL